ncbi:hypothetical protein RB195_013263 [Necator americanus]|uniref:Uncharacterized protein n=1 Tax=Necator americanus TaxID=51031 RepID=A0ABR1DUQ2_NECAM
MQLKIVLAFIMLSAVVAYPYQILPWQEAKKTWNKIVNRNLKVMAKSMSSTLLGVKEGQRGGVEEEEYMRLRDEGDAKLVDR